MDNGTIALIIVLAIIGVPVLIAILAWILNLFNLWRSGH
jgi:hypothetical protein